MEIVFLTFDTTKNEKYRGVFRGITIVVRFAKVNSMDIKSKIINNKKKKYKFYLNVI